MLMQQLFDILRSASAWRIGLAALLFHGTALAVTLQDFGYQHMNVNGKLAIGTRPLLLIVANFAGETNSDGTAAPLPHDAAYYDNLVFNQAANPTVTGYFSAMSNGRFSWTRAGVVSLSLPQSAWDSTWPGPGGDPGHDQPYMSNIVYQAMLATNQFNFKAYDNGDHHITLDELGILIIGNDFTACRDTGVPVTSPDGTYDWGQGSDLRSCRIGTDKDTDTAFIVMNEEFEETLGTPDIYGDQKWNTSLTPQAAYICNENCFYSYYLDPWNRMSLGWCSPHIISMATGGVVTIPAAQAGDPTAPVILYDSAHGTNEYWILEYRTQTSPYGSGYDANVAAFAPSTNRYGLAVWHIQQNGNHDLVGTVKNDITGGVQQADWNEGPPNLKWGSPALWGSDSITPPLTWWNGDNTGMSLTPSATHLHVRPFSQGDGSITVEVLTAGVDWVDFNYSIFSPQLGTFANPYSTLTEGVSGLPYGTPTNTIYIKPGNSPETMTISKPMTITAVGGAATVGKTQ